MTRVFQVFRERAGVLRALPAGLAWSAMPLPWAWAFRHGLWFRALGLLAVDALGVFLAASLFTHQTVALVLLFLAPRLVAAFRGSSWRAARLEHLGVEYLGDIVARGGRDALAQVARRGGEIPDELRPRSTGSGFAFPPRSWQRLLAVARLTIRAAFRYRLVVVLMIALLGAVLVLPTVLKHDGTAEGFTRILLTYTLGVITALLSVVTLWLACGTLAQDVDDCQMQVVASKPIPRWQIWLGKWTGIVVLDALLLVVAAGAVFFLMQWRAQQLPSEVQEALRNKVLIARASVKEPAPEVDSKVDELIRARLPDLKAQGINIRDFRAQAREALKAREQVVPPEHLRRYHLDVRGDARKIRGQPVFVRIKFHTPELSAKRPYEIEVAAGPPESAARRTLFRSLAAEASHELEMGSVELNPDGTLTVDVANRSDTPLIFPADDGFEILYREGGFELNYVRALLVILCWLGLLAAIGLAAASFLSFPVAAFLATTVLVLSLSTGTLKTVVEDNTVLGFEHDSTERLHPAFDALMVPVFRVVLETVNLAKQFSPIDSVSSGRSISWGDLARAILVVIGLLGGGFAAVGIWAFTRRELATAQSNH